MLVGPSLSTICLLALFMALPLGVVAAACALAAEQGKRRYVLLASVVVAVLASVATLLFPPGATRIASSLLLGLGMIGTIAAGVLMLLRKDGTTTATIVGLIAAPFATAGHLMESAPILAALGPPGVTEQTESSLAALLAGLGAGTVSILLVAALLLVLQRAWEPIGTGVALGAIAAALATGAQLLFAGSGPELPALPSPAVMATVLGLVFGTLIGAMRGDRSGALAGMPPGNH